MAEEISSRSETGSRGPDNSLAEQLRRLREKYPRGGSADPLSRRRFLSDTALMAAGVLGSTAFPAPRRLVTRLLGEASDKLQREIHPEGVANRSTYEPAEKSLLLGQKRLRLIDVNPDLEVFDRNEADIRRWIANAPFVVLDHFPRDEELVGDGKALSEKDEESPTDAFFNRVAEVAAEYGKEIVVVNPETAGNRCWESLLLLGLPAGTLLSRMDKLIADMVERAKGEPMNRRRFLRWAAFLPAGLIGGSYAFAGLPQAALKKIRDAYPEFSKRMRKVGGVLEEEGVINEDMAEWQKAQILGLHMVDFRNRDIARGILSARQEFEDEWGDGEVPVFLCDGKEEVDAYLRSKFWRKRKKHPVHAHLGNRHVRLYKHRDGSWLLAENMPYKKDEELTVAKAQD